MQALTFLADDSAMDGPSLSQREVRRDFSWLGRSPRPQTLFVTRLVGRQIARLSILAAGGAGSVVRRIELAQASDAERRPVRRPVWLPAHKNQRYSCRWVFAYRTARREFVCAASAARGGVQRQSDLNVRSELWFSVGDCRVTSGQSPPAPPFSRGGG